MCCCQGKAPHLYVLYQQWHSEQHGGTRQESCTKTLRYNNTIMQECLESVEYRQVYIDIAIISYLHINWMSEKI